MFNSCSSRRLCGLKKSSRRLRNLEKAGIIQGYTALIDQNAYGLPITVFVRIRLEHHSRESVQTFEQHIARIDEILDCYLMTGGADYLLRVEVASAGDFEAIHKGILSRLPGVQRIHSSFAIRNVLATRLAKNR